MADSYDHCRMSIIIICMKINENKNYILLMNYIDHCTYFMKKKEFITRVFFSYLKKAKCVVRHETMSSLYDDRTDKRMRRFFFCIIQTPFLDKSIILILKENFDVYSDIVHLFDLDCMYSWIFYLYISMK